MVWTRSEKKRLGSPLVDPLETQRGKRPRNQGDSPETARGTFQGVKVVLLDIEGTICPISWVKETLFPYALQALPNVLATKWDDDDFKKYREAFPKSATASPAAFEAHVMDLSERDVKVACLKNLQGYLWEDGYRTHAYATPVYPDVLKSFDKWTVSSLHKLQAIAIYSSGSVFAQKLLFQHVQDPAKPNDLEAVLDCRDIIKAWFDTTNAGPKHESLSYAKIADELGREPSEILFLSDNVKEVQAAKAANLQAAVVDRPGNAPLSVEERDRFVVLESFEQLALNTQSKRPKRPQGKAAAKPRS